MGGQLGNDIVNKLVARGNEAMYSDITLVQSGEQDSAACAHVLHDEEQNAMAMIH